LNLSFVATELPEISAAAAQQQSHARKSQMNHHSNIDGPQGVAKKRQANNSEMRITNFH